MKHLSRFDIEAIADKYVQAYMALPDVRNTQIYRIDPELLLEKVLGLNVEYQHLSYDGSILGMTSFTEMGVQVFEDDDNEAFFFLDGKTVLVEKDLNFDSKLKGRKNFTLMHEGSHQIFKMLFPNDYGVTQKSAGVHYYKANSERNKPISDWEEWQANTLGAAILLPENLVKQGMYLFSLGEKIAILTSILRKLRLANAKFRCWISSKKHSLWKRKDRSCLIFIAKLLWTDILILSFLTVLDSRNIKQPLTKQYVVLSVTAMMNSS